MKAVLCKQYGAPSALVVEEVPAPVPGPGQVLVEVHAAGVNFPDTLIIQGKYQLKAQPPFVPGAGVTGTVLEVGEKVKHLKAGDAVAALINVGGFASEAVADAAFLGPAGARELRGDEPALSSLRAELRTHRWTDDQIDGYLKALDRVGQPTAYLFECRSCGTHLAYSDFT